MLDPEADAALYREAVASSELSANHFCEWIAWRDERTGRRWLAGEPMPEVVRKRLRWFMGLTQNRRSVIARLASLRAEP